MNRQDMGYINLLTVIIAAIFITGFVVLGINDHRSVERCKAIGGQTWDSGEHCTIGGRTVSTR